MTPDEAAKIAAQITVKHAENVRILATAYPFRSLPGLVEIAQTSLAADIAKVLQDQRLSPANKTEDQP